MSFSEELKKDIKKKANFTCCWCQNRQNKVDVHHIIPASENGPDVEDNAAPLCGSCHDLYGANPELRKEIRLRRDHWYETCTNQFQQTIGWPVGLDVPILDFYYKLPQGIRDKEGIQFTDKDIHNDKQPPVLYLSAYYKPPSYRPSRPDQREKWFTLSCDMRFAFHFSINVCAWNDQDVTNIVNFLQGRTRYCDLTSQDQQPEMNIFVMFRENGENRLVLSTINTAHSTISIRARFSDKVAKAFFDYLTNVGFTEIE